MLRYLIIEVLYMVYLGGFLLICLHHLSAAVFGKAQPYPRTRDVLGNVLFALLWPLALFSPNGRQELKHKLIHFF